MSGWIKIHRDINQHWIWQDANYLKWWLDILLEVNHTEGEIVIKGTVLKCGRGEKLYSLDTWASRWNTNKSKVNRFLKMLEKQNMISLKSETHTTRLKVCKYDDYQDKDSKSETQTKRKRNANETEVKSIQEEKEYKEINNSIMVSSKPNKKILLSEVDINTLSEQDQIYFKIAIGFRDLFIKNKKALGVNDFKDQDNSTYKGYVDPVRLAFTQDKKTEEDFRKVYAFLMKDEFWMKNIMSTHTLRKKMSDLLLRCSSLPKKKLKLPQGYFNMKLNNEQMKLLPEDELRRYKTNMIKLEMDGGFIKQAPIEYED
jgi:DNA-binding transcriptional regulator YhcF (GntR family)